MRKQETPNIRKYINKAYGESESQMLWDDINKLIELYALYDGDAQDWDLPSGLDYKPTKKKTNHTKHLIKEAARFMFSRTPEINIMPIGKDEQNKEICEELQRWIRATLENSGWQEKLSQAGRDCFVGKRVALKLNGGNDRPLKVLFKPAISFFHRVDDEDSDIQNEIIYYHHTLSKETDPSKQRTWVQHYWLAPDGGSWYREFIMDGNGNIIEYNNPSGGDGDKTGIMGIPSCVILNDGLTGDILGESDVDEIKDNQDVYNRQTSDAIDALKFNMFPQRVFTDASQESMDAVKVSPGASLDISTDPSVTMTRQAKIEVIEAGFNYDSALENSLSRLRLDMYTLLSVPELSVENLKSLGISGKAMRALYWALLCRCEERWATWDTALKWMVRMMVQMAQAYGMEGGAEFAKAQYTIDIAHLYPIPDDEEEERELDMKAVTTKLMSREAYIRKWYPDEDPEIMLQKIAEERQLLEVAYNPRMI